MFNFMDSPEFRAWRLKRYRTQDQAAEAFGVTRDTIHCWERNKTPNANWRMIELACVGLDLERRESEAEAFRRLNEKLQDRPC